MSDIVFNTTFEISIRLLLVLSVCKNSRFTLDNLVTVDFIANYSKEFGLSDNNLHGNNEFSFSEFSIRRALGQKAIKELVLEDMVKVSCTKKGFLYSITDKGQSLCNKLTSDYAIEYKSNVDNAIKYINSKTEKEILNLISQEASKLLRKEE
ncbi:hypothetical protein EQM13_16125 [Acidilutibacter cellobiosedens]|uniref:Uncharacterized protein n=1 Tax=Acidilutibacter cellobiosedens TaxID=2507161 RepID=A0A410QG38_9FIRM|nr:ABC-three component system middle component 2 [Acidilutibacter cellobiosedens]QAT62980.1 hypothetical protein EQM13_16125 [Acidilutibacter cellobiosedens]